MDGCGICGSDLTSYKVGLFTGCSPRSRDRGRHRRDRRRGQRVDIGRKRGRRSEDPVRRLRRLPGGRLVPMRDGPHRRYRVRPRRRLRRARCSAGGAAPSPAPGLALEHAPLVEPLSVAIHGVDRARLHAGEPAVVIGLGPSDCSRSRPCMPEGSGRSSESTRLRTAARSRSTLGAATVVSELREVRIAHRADAGGHRVLRLRAPPPRRG